MKKRHAGWAAVIACSASTNALCAQGNEVGTSAAQPPRTTPAAEAEARDGQLEDIVVTATRREERLQDIPVTVTALTAETLSASGVDQMRSLTEVVPAYTGGRNISSHNPAIRGIGSIGVSAGDESNIATYIDGVYQPDAYSNFIELVEVERVEVLRGPQGTVFGRNATGGLINVITPDPSFQTRGRVAARYGRTRNDAADYDLRAYITTGLTNQIAVDFAGLYRENEDYIEDLVRGGHIGGSRIINLRSKLLFRPTENANIILTGEYFDRRSEETAVQPFENNTAGRTYPGVILPTGPWQASLTEEPALDAERYNVSLRTEFEFEGVDLETTTGYMDSTVYQLSDSDATNIFLAQVPVTTKVESFSQEIRLLSNGDGPLNWIVGAYAFWLDASQDIDVQNARGPGTPVVHTRLQPELETTSYAGFAEGTYEITESLFLTAGGRYTDEKREFRQRVNGNQLPFGTAKKSFNKFTYRLAVRYEIADNANIFASYGTGFKSGVFNSVGTSPIATDPENVKAAEVGIKADPLPWLRTNLSIYHYDYEDLQAQARDAGGALYVLQNAADAEIYGGELEITAAATPDLNLRAAAAYTHGEYSRFPAAQTFVPLPTGGNSVQPNDVAGKQIVRAPRYTFNVGGDWSHDLAGGRLTLAGNVFHSARVYYDFLNLFAQKSYTLVNGELSWRSPDERWRLSLFATNITNAKVAQMLRPGPLGTDLFYERPRRVGIGAELKF